ncbi:hypothetical protein RHAL1_03690 [Beijerinckiaceae bacterium RH AL1]|nr:hypothetical protein [Beijerinckiaceae bacterium]VVB49166.1 hypothetical protein RHCH11_RHCH11_03621 [Beijerinckiaceae bacterium RH CH11]VVB49245.1 hypothetical protein RHAL8_03617 [Beijerinckiaceae bacterium RH AL8]VVC56761.1 hypothetical protein RHAL1_03690 [Beijerinckiaceae bacterium RH AL1]
MTLEQIAGAALTLLFLADIFLTLLYARAGVGLLAPYWAQAVWASFAAVAKLLHRRRGKILSFAGPTIVVSLIGFWSVGLSIGAALVIQPELGHAVRSSSGDTSNDFITALLVGGNSLSIVGGSSGYAPFTAGARSYFLVNSLIGASVLSLVLSYLVQVYSTLRERNALALSIHLMTGGTGDAAEMLARLAPDGDCSNAVSELGNLARSLALIKEAHHFYPLLFYFRFENSLYAVSRFGFVLLDLVTLIRTALDQQRCRSLVRSVPVEALHQCTVLLLETLDRSFPTFGNEPSEAASLNSAQSYTAAVETLARAGLPAQMDGIDRYVAERRRWEPLARRVAPTLGYSMHDIDLRRPQMVPANSSFVG